jgi:hypothetical protein
VRTTSAISLTAEIAVVAKNLKEIAASPPAIGSSGFIRATRLETTILDN